jgi:copper chaperone
LGVGDWGLEIGDWRLGIGDWIRSRRPKIEHHISSIIRKKEKKMKTVTLYIPNISCQHCIMTIKRESGFVDGVEFVSGDIAGKTATVQVANDEALERLKQTLVEVGYPTA